MTLKKDSVLVAMAALGFLLATVAGIMVWEVPSFNQVLQNPITDVIVVLVALATSAALLLWARQPGHRDREAFVAAITGAGILVVIANVFAPAIGWWGGTFFQAPLLILALLTGVGAMGWFALLLMGYRWLAARKPKLALLVYGLIMLVLLPASTVIGDQFATRSGVVTFGGGYTVWHDVLVGEVFFLAPILLYEVLRRRLDAPPATHSEALPRR